MQDEHNLKDVGLLALRLTAGGLLAGHGAQKLFGTFGGPGLEGTTGFMDMLGLKPARPWAYLAGLSEFGGGALTALGLMQPLASLGIIGAMTMAAGKAHWGKPIWVTSGGAEVPAINLAVATALAFTGPGRFSLDRALGIRVPLPLLALATAATATGIAYGLTSGPKQGATPSHLASPPKSLLAIVNPIVKAILRSPFHGPISDKMMLLTFTGRKSGEQFTTPVSYQREGDTLYVFTHSPWARNLEGGAPVTALVQGEEMDGWAEAVHDETQMLDRIQSFLQHEGVANARRIGLRFDHMPTRDELRAVVTDLVMIGVDVGGRSYYLPTESSVATSRS